MTRRLLVMTATLIVTALTHSMEAVQKLPLNALTVPATTLPAECRLEEGANGNVRKTFATNPWTGDDPSVLSQITSAMGVALMSQVPDGPPLDRRQLADFQRRAFEAVNEGYRASYDDADGPDLEVLALEFQNSQQASAFHLTSLAGRNFRSARFLRGTALVVVNAYDAHSGCFEAVRAHVAALK